MRGSRFVALFGGRPSWVPTANGTAASIYANFALDQYRYNSTTYGSFAALLTALSGTFSRASTAYYTNSAGLLASAASGALRFDYDPVTLAARGILLEGARTNVVLWNRDLTNAAWTATDVTVAKDQTGADGSANAASSLTATAGNGTVVQAITLASSARYQSAYVKRLTGTGVVEMTMDNGTTWTAIVPTASWTALTIPTQTLANPTVGFRIVTSGDAIAVDFVGNENGVFRSSPIPTTTVSVTRAADSLVVTPVPWFNSLAGSIVTAADFASVNGNLNQTIFRFSDNSNNNLIDALYSGQSAVTTAPRFEVISGGVISADINLANVGAALHKQGAAWSANDFATLEDGGTPSTDSGGSIPSGIDRLNFGTSQAGSSGLFGRINSFAYFPVRASNGELQRLTT